MADQSDQSPHITEFTDRWNKFVLGIHDSDVPAAPPDPSPAASPGIEDYIAGRIVAYCDMVKRGQKLASSQAIRVEQFEVVTALIASEGCLWRQGPSSGRIVYLWIYVDPALVPVLAAIDEVPDSPLRHFAFGKLCGYADAAVMDFERRSRQDCPTLAASPGVDPLQERLAALAWDTSWRNHERCSDDGGEGSREGHVGPHRLCPHPDCALVRSRSAIPAAAGDQAQAAIHRVQEFWNRMRLVRSRSVMPPDWAWHDELRDILAGVEVKHGESS